MPSAAIPICCCVERAACQVAPAAREVAPATREAARAASPRQSGGTLSGPAAAPPPGPAPDAQPRAAAARRESSARQVTGCGSERTGVGSVRPVTQLALSADELLERAVRPQAPPPRPDPRILDFELGESAAHGGALTL